MFSVKNVVFVGWLHKIIIDNNKNIGHMKVKRPNSALTRQ